MSSALGKWDASVRSLELADDPALGDAAARWLAQAMTLAAQGKWDTNVGDAAAKMGADFSTGTGRHGVGD